MEYSQTGRVEQAALKWSFNHDQSTLKLALEELKVLENPYRYAQLCQQNNVAVDEEEWLRDCRLKVDK